MTRKDWIAWGLITVIIVIACLISIFAETADFMAQQQCEAHNMVYKGIHLDTNTLRPYADCESHIAPIFKPGGKQWHIHTE